MARIAEANHFVRIDQLPQITDSTPLARVFSELHHRSAGGFILVSGGQPRYFVSAAGLAEVARSEARGSSWQEVSSRPLTEFLQKRQKELDLVPVVRTVLPAGTESSTVSRDIAAVYIVMHEAQHLGWYFTAERHSDQVQTAPPVFTCVQGHENPDPDEGYCSQCPSELKP